AAPALDLQSLLQSGREHLYKWRIDEAAGIADQALEIAADPQDKGLAYYLKSEVEFHKGNYRKAGDYVRKANELLPNYKEIGDFLSYVSKLAETGEKFKEVKAEHFKIKYFHPSDAVLVGYAEDTLKRAYFEIGSDLEFYPDDPITVEIYPDPESFALASTLSKEDIKTTGVVGICKFNRLMIISPRLLPKGYAWLDTLSHEYTHYLLFLKSENTVPVWLHEGIAKFEEKRWKNKGINILNPLYETLLARALKENNLVSMDEMYPSFGKLSSAYRAQLAFAQVGTIVDFLVRKWGNNSLNRLLESLRQKDDYETAVKRVTNISFSEFYDSWIADLRSRNLVEKIPGIEVKELEFQKSGSESKDQSVDLKELDNSKARNYTRLGDMLKVRGRLRAAAYEYEKALNLDPISPIILNRIAGVETALGEYEKAEEKLSPLVEIHPEYVDTYINLGRIYLQRKNYTKAQEAYETAISINPFNPEIHVALISIYEKLGMADLVKSEKIVLSILLKEE
ncbi:MAG TPA: tetratricopeptide repeat protein, partial [Thermodesulfobacteriota bacterium]|nr:tetratricopeptide repeat protein [Thermodesulfobacteriota bacterium]